MNFDNVNAHDNVTINADDGSIELRCPCEEGTFGWFCSGCMVDTVFRSTPDDQANDTAMLHNMIRAFGGEPNGEAAEPRWHGPSPVSNN